MLEKYIELYNWGSWFDNFSLFITVTLCNYLVKIFTANSDTFSHFFYYVMSTVLYTVYDKWFLIVKRYFITVFNFFLNMIFYQNNAIQLFLIFVGHRKNTIEFQLLIFISLRLSSFLFNFILVQSNCIEIVIICSLSKFLVVENWYD